MNDVRAYGRMELAARYFPAATPAHAWRMMRIWIDRMPGLGERLGQMKGRIFTPRQVRLLFEAFGEPE